MINRIGKSLLASLATAVFGFATFGATQAAVYHGTWDPLYGSPYTNLGWRGGTNVNIPLATGCFSNGGSTTACLSGAFLQDAEVVFYDFTTNTNLARIDWSTGELSGVSISGILDDGVKPVQLDTAIFNGFPFKSPIPIGGFSADTPYGGFLSDSFTLQFLINGFFVNPPNTYDFGPLGGPFSGPVLFADTCGDGCVGFNDWKDNPPVNFTFTQVPEPGTLALAALALVAAGSAARRTRPAQTRRTK